MGTITDLQLPGNDPGLRLAQQQRSLQEQIDEIRNLQRRRVVYGRVNANGTIQLGSGFSVVKLNTGQYQINLDTPLPGPPAVTVTCAAWGLGCLDSASASVVTILTLDVITHNWGDFRFDFRAEA